MLTASESGSTNDMFCLKVLPWTLAEVRQSLCRVFVLQPVIENHHPPCIFGASGKPRGRVPLPQIKSGENLLNKRKTPACCVWVASGSGSLEELRSDTGLCRALCWYIKYRCLSICDASSIFYVSFLTKFCISWYLRSSDLSQFQRILTGSPSWSLNFIPLFSPGILDHFFICP